MSFASSEFLAFFLVVFFVYWTVRVRAIQNLLLLIGSYFFYGFIHPWFCLLLAFSTVLDYFCGLGMAHYQEKRKAFLILSLTGNLGMLGFFKYFNFFVDSVAVALEALALRPNLPFLNVVLPVGISFYTFQTMSYTIDIYRGEMQPRKRFVDFAVFVSMFPQLVAGPIERAIRFLPQIEQARTWSADNFYSGFSLILRGYLFKLVVADNLALYVEKIYALNHPSLLLILSGAFVFSLQMYGDFHGYSLIARGLARLMGFNLVKNFDSPMRSISPQEFWRRWHISFSTWIKDYLFKSLVSMKTGVRWTLISVTITMALSGLWHGAQWTYVVWGLYHGALLVLYRVSRLDRWEPHNIGTYTMAFVLFNSMFLFHWALFRSHDLAWAFKTMIGSPVFYTEESLYISLLVFAVFTLYTLPLALVAWVDKYFKTSFYMQSALNGAVAAMICVFANTEKQDFLYFQF